MFNFIYKWYNTRRHKKYVQKSADIYAPKDGSSGYVNFKDKQPEVNESPPIKQGRMHKFKNNRFFRLFFKRKKKQKN
jgi:hypothetical protein